MAKTNYKDKIENKLTSVNAREAWQGLNIMMGKAPKPAGINCSDAEQQSSLTTFSAGSTAAVHQQARIIDEELVASVLSRVNPHRAPGPDRLRGRVLKDCSTQLSGVFTKLFQSLLGSSFVPHRWKETTVVPIPIRHMPKTQRILGQLP